MNVNTISCLAQNANTGYADCPVHIKFEGAIEVPASKRFTKAEVQALGTTLNAMIINASKSSRAFPFPPFIKDESTGGDPNNVEFDNGEEITTWENYYKLNFSFYRGGLPLSNALRSRNGRDTAFLFYGNGIVFGTTINGEYAGVPVYNFWSTAKPGAFKRENAYSWKGSTPVPFLTDKVWYVEDDFGAADLKGLHIVDLSTTTTPEVSATGLAILDVKERGYGTDYGALYPTELAAVTWTCKNRATGLAIVVTGVTVVGGKLNVNLDDTDLNYPATGEWLTIVPPNVTSLIAGGILNAEIEPLDIKVTV